MHMTLIRFVLFLLPCACFFIPLPLRAQSLTARIVDQYAALARNEDNLGEPARLHRLFDLNWEYRMLEFPTFATYAGYPGQDDRWTDHSLDAVARRKRELAEGCQLEPGDIVWVSAAKGSNIDQLRGLVTAHLVPRSMA